MRGTVLLFDRETGQGLLVDAAGQRRPFARSDWRGSGEARAGAPVDFEVAGDGAGEIFLLPEADGSVVARNALVFGILSLGLAAISPFIGAPGLATLALAILFGFLGMKGGRDLFDRIAYRLSIAGLVLSGLALVVVLAFIGVLSRTLSSRPDGAQAVTVNTIAIRVETPTVSNDQGNAP